MATKVKLILDNEQVSVRFIYLINKLGIKTTKELRQISELPVKLQAKLGFGTWTRVELQLVVDRLDDMNAKDIECPNLEITD